MNMPFSRPGALDLSALKASPPSAPASGGASPKGARFDVEVDDTNFQALLESSMTAPVVLVVYNASAPNSVSLADDLATLASEAGGRFVVGRVDAQQQGSVVAALQVEAVPYAAMVLQGRLAPLLADAPPLAELRPMIQQLLATLAGQGMTGQHPPFSPASSADVGDDSGAEDTVDPRYAPAEDALMAGDYEAAKAAYQALIDERPADAEAIEGLARVTLLHRAESADAAAARQAAAGDPDDVAAQLLVADLDVLGGHVDDAFARLIALVRRTADEERESVRKHLIDLFLVVGNDDARVRKARGALASALF